MIACYDIFSCLIPFSLARKTQELTACMDYHEHGAHGRCTTLKCEPIVVERDDIQFVAPEVWRCGTVDRSHDGPLRDH